MADSIQQRREATSAPAIVSRSGSRQELVDRFVAAWDDNLAPPALWVDPDPRRAELERDRAPLVATQRDQHRAILGEVEAEHRRPFEERLATANDEQERTVVIYEMRDALEENRPAIQAEAGRRLALMTPDPRSVSIATELAEIDRVDAQTRRALLTRWAGSMRRALSVPVAPDGIMAALDRLAGQHKWPANIDRRTYLAVMAEEIEAEGFPAAVVAKAVRLSAGQHEWVPSTAQFLGECREVARALWATTWLLEDKNPARFSDRLYAALEAIEPDKRASERERLGRLAYNHLRAFHNRDPAPPGY